MRRIVALLWTARLLMKIHGTLIKWNDDRGFGFVVIPQSHEEIFVHISAFPRDGVRPRVGETISFEVRSGPDGRKRAEGVARPGARTAPRKDSDASVDYKHGNSPLRAAFAIAIIVTLGVVAYRGYTSRHNIGDEVVLANPQPNETADQQFKCDGRTQCSQMTSCAEAIYFLQHCPNTQMDGNNDGEPCEQQWCN